MPHLSPRLASAKRKLRPHLWPILALAAACAWLYSVYIIQTYAGADFPPAVSYAMNFKTAFDHGQWLPRLVEFPREFQVGMGSVDGTTPTADAPVFQYYAFLASALAYPFLSLGVPAPNAVGCAILLAFLIGMVALYAAAIILGASRGIAALATWSYLVSPWLISNIYGRGGVAEGVSHALMPIVLLGIAFAWVGRYRAAVVATAAGVGLLALSHNIFLLYGMVLAMGITWVASVVAVSMDRPTTVRSTLQISAPAIAVSIGLVAGLAITAWQWVPGYLGIVDTTFANNVNTRVIPEDFSSMSGVFGLPQRYSHAGAAPTPFFFTIGWWTIPSVVAALFLSAPHQRKLAIAVAVTFFLLFCACYFPKLVFPLLPPAFGATQVTFRLLSVLSLCGAFALCLVRFKGRSMWLVFFALAMTLSQYGVISYRLPVFRFTDAQYEQGWEVNAFSRASDFTVGPLRQDQLGAIMDKNVVLLQHWRDMVGYPNGPLHLRITGDLSPANTPPFDLSVKDLSSGRALGASRVEGTKVDVTVLLEGSAEKAHINVPSANGQWSVLKSRSAYLIALPATSYVYSDDIEKTYSHGLNRTFVTRPDRRGMHRPTDAGYFVLEIPMVGSRFLIARQYGQVIPHWSDLNNRLNVRVADLTRPVDVSYEIPGWIWAITLAGLALIGGLCFWRGSSKPG